MKRKILSLTFIFFGFCSITLLGQNLIPDPGFEDWDGTIGINPNTLGGLNFWYNANGTPDHHHQDNAPGSNLTSLEDCPLFLGQTQCGKPYMGKAVLGLYKGNGIIGTKEWAGIELTEPLQTGRCYRVSYWLQNKKDNPNFFMATSQWGMFFSQTKLPSFSVNASDYNFLQEQWVSTTELLDHNSEWVYYEHDLKAELDYPFVFVGYVGNPAEADMVNWSTSGSVGFYSWMDEVSIVDITPDLTMSQDNNICYGDSVLLEFNSNYPIEWTEGTTIHTSISEWVYPTVTTDYIVHTIDPTDCTQYDTITVHVLGPEFAEFAADNLEGCNPMEVQFEDLSSIPGQSYFWEFGDGSSSSDPLVTSHQYDAPGTYDVQLTIEYGIGCSFTIDLGQSIIVDEIPEADFNFDPMNPTVDNSTVNFTNESTGNIINYTWDFGDGSTSNEENPNHDFQNPGPYDISLIVETVGGCLDTIEYRIIIESALKIFIPNIFSPNRDGINDDFQVYFKGDFKSYHLFIYDRWGNQVFESEDPLDIWNGKFNERAVLQGVYSYVLEYQILDIVTLEYVNKSIGGSVTLIR